MILNPVIQGGAEEKMYKITDEVSNLGGISFPAGSIVKGDIDAIIFGEVKIMGADGTFIPNYYYPDKRKDSIVFVMPAQDVRIYEE